MSKIQNGDVFDVDEYVDSLNNNSINKIYPAANETAGVYFYNPLL